MPSTLPSYDLEQTTTFNLLISNDIDSNLDSFISKDTKKTYFLDTLDLQRYKNIELKTKKRLIRTCIKF